MISKCSQYLEKYNLMKKTFIFFLNISEKLGNAVP
jgi:hypothetical protein